MQSDIKAPIKNIQTDTSKHNKNTSAVFVETSFSQVTSYEKISAFILNTAGSITILILVLNCILITCDVILFIYTQQTNNANLKPFHKILIFMYIPMCAFSNAFVWLTLKRLIQRYNQVINSDRIKWIWFKFILIGTLLVIPFIYSYNATFYYSYFIIYMFCHGLLLFKIRNNFNCLDSKYINAFSSLRRLMKLESIGCIIISIILLAIDILLKNANPEHWVLVLIVIITITQFLYLIPTHCVRLIYMTRLFFNSANDDKIASSWRSKDNLTDNKEYDFAKIEAQNDSFPSKKQTLSFMELYAAGWAVILFMVMNFSISIILPILPSFSKYTFNTGILNVLFSFIKMLFYIYSLIITNKLAILRYGNNGFTTYIRYMIGIGIFYVLATFFINYKASTELIAGVAGLFFFILLNILLLASLRQIKTNIQGKINSWENLLLSEIGLFVICIISGLFVYSSKIELVQIVSSIIFFISGLFAMPIYIYENIVHAQLLFNASKHEEIFNLD